MKTSASRDSAPRMRACIGLLFATVALASSTAGAVAIANPPPPPPAGGDAMAVTSIVTQFVEGDQDYRLTSDLNTTLSNTVTEGATLFATATLSSTTSPWAQASASQAGFAASLGAGASSTLTYFVKVDGPTAAATLDLVGHGSTTAGGVGAVAMSRIQFEDAVVGWACASGAADYCAATAATFDLDGRYTVATGTWLPVTLYVVAGTSGFGTEDLFGGEAYESASAWVDPTFSIDPLQDDGGAYRIEFSPQLLMPVPEPINAALLAAGLCLLGAAARRTRGSR